MVSLKVKKYKNNILPIVSNAKYDFFTRKVVKINDNSYLTKIESNSKSIYIKNEFASMIHNFLNDKDENIKCYISEIQNCVFFKNIRGSELLISGVKLHKEPQNI